MAELLDEIHPGEILLEDFMKPMGISARQLAADIDVSPSRISRDGALTIDHLANAAGRYINVRCQLAGRDAHRFHEVFQQYFARVYFF